MRNSLVKGFINEQKKLGGIVPSMLKDGDQVIIETDEFVYEITVSLAMPTPRFILASGSPTCAKYGNILLDIKSRNRKLKYDMEDWIGKGVSLLYCFQGGTNVLTGAVTGATLVGKRKDGTEYKYDFWA